MKSGYWIGNLPSLLKKKLNSKECRSFIIAAIVVLSGSLYFYHAEIPRVLAQSAIGSLNETVAPAEGQRVLVFSPHPDDETIAVGGYIAQSRKEGADIRIVLVTNGNYHHEEALRYSEFKKATGILGVPESNLIFLNFPDGKLREQNEATLYKALKEQVDLYNPDIVIYPDPRDYNPDHSTTGRIVEKILKAEPHKRIVYRYLVHYELLYPRPREFDPNLYLLPPRHLLTSDTEWQQFPLSQNIENLKMQAIFVYKSQLNDPWLKGLLLSSIRRNELLAIPKDLGTQYTSISPQ
jgi:LmbE family N-acetylglucosaminyl deacetylase